MRTIKELLVWTAKGETQPTNKTPDDYLDFATAVVDPSDDLTFWVVHEYADKARNGYKTVVAKIKKP